MTGRGRAEQDGAQKVHLAGPRGSSAFFEDFREAAPTRAAEDPDVALMLAVRDGNRQAFEELFTKHAAGVVRFARQFVGSHARAEELAQDVFMGIYRARRRYVPAARFKTWLYRIVTNACRSELRRPERRRRVPLLAEEESRQQRWPHAAAGRSGEEILLTREALVKMQQVLASLPPQQRAALLLARVEGMSYEEVAGALACSVSAVKSLVHRATVALRAGVPEGDD